MKLSKPMPYPGELKNLLKTAIAFSDVMMRWIISEEYIIRYVGKSQRI